MAEGVGVVVDVGGMGVATRGEGTTVAVCTISRVKVISGVGRGVLVGWLVGLVVGVAVGFTAIGVGVKPFSGHK